MLKKTDFLSLELPGKHRIPSIDYLRTVAIFLVILIHTQPPVGAFESYITGNGRSLIEASIDFGLDRMMVLAIPFLFLVAGYFFGQKMLSSDSPIRTLGTYLRRLIIAWFFWRIFYHLMPSPRDIENISQDGLLKYLYSLYIEASAGLFDFFIIQAPPHLWFMPALITALCIVTCFSFIKKQWLVLPLVVSLYVYCVATNTYATTPLRTSLNSFLALDFPLVNCYAVVFVYTGWYLATKKIVLESRQAAKLIVLGVIISCIELLFFWKEIAITARHASHTIGALFLVIGLTMYAFSMPNIGKNNVAAKFGRYGLGIYLVHYFFLFWTDSLNRQLGYPLGDIIQPLAVYLFSLVVAILLSKSKWLRPIVV